MSPRSWLSICLYAVLIGATQARASTPAEAVCQGDERTVPCQEAELQRKLQVFGLEPIERHREAGDQVRRAFYVDGYGNDVVAVAFVRSPGRDSVLRVHSRRWDGEDPIPPLEAPVPEKAWRDLLRRSAHFDKALASTSAKNDGDGDGEESIVLCIHGWDYTIEATDPTSSEFEKGEMRRNRENACDNGLVEVLAQEMYEAAIPLLAPCALLDPNQYRNGAALLRSCARLRGDRLAAAAVVNRVDEFHSFEVDRFTTLAQVDISDLEELFHSDGTVDWNGERNGSVDPVPFLISKLSGAEQFDFRFEWAEGVRSDRVRVTGTLERSIKAEAQEPREERAPFEQVWTLHGDKFYLESMTIGAFGPVEVSEG